MKSLPLTACALILAVSAAPAFAQQANWYMPTGLYGTLGYSNLDTASGPDVNLSGVTGRLGARFGRYLGVEGEITGGIGEDHYGYGGDSIKAHLDDQYAGYAVGYLPITPQFELLARVGYGGQDYRVKDFTALTTEGYHYDSINYGAGAQYNFTPKDGVRVDYTRIDAQGNDNPDSNVWNISYVRRF
jgi:outer membrane immunogenic protein